MCGSIIYGKQESGIGKCTNFSKSWKFEYCDADISHYTKLMLGRSKMVSLSIFPRANCKAYETDCRVRQINNYLLKAKIGTGSSSKVYMGIDEETGEKHAIKRIKMLDLSRKCAGIAQLEREIRLMQKFDHPNILKLKEVLHDKASQEAYLVLEYAEKGSLATIIDRGIELSRDAIFSVIKQVTTAMKYLHDREFVHQDIKPGNILIDGTGRAVLADFGIGHTFQSSGMVIGSPAFQAPEALDDDIWGDEEDGESSSYSETNPQKEDVWALGITLYQLLYRKLPFIGNNLFEIVNDIKERSLLIPEQQDPRVEGLLRSMLAVDPQQRCTAEDILAHDLIANAPDRANIPYVLKMKEFEGETIKIEAERCNKGYSFACAVLPQRRLSYGSMSGQLYQFPRINTFGCGSTDSASDEHETMVGVTTVSDENGIRRFSVF